MRWGEDDMYRVSDALGARSINAALFDPVPVSHDALVESFAALCDRAAGHGLLVSLEFMPFSQVASIEAALAIVEVADRPNGGILVDTLYLHLSRVDIGELLHVPSDLLHFLHISDCLPGIADTREGMIQLARDARLYPGEGWIDFTGIIERMPPVDYSIELPNAARVAELGYEEHARRCLQHAKRKFGAARSQRRAIDLVPLQTKEECYGQRAH